MFRGIGHSTKCNIHAGDAIIGMRNVALWLDAQADDPVQINAVYSTFHMFQASMPHIASATYTMLSDVSVKVLHSADLNALKVVWTFFVVVVINGDYDKALTIPPVLEHTIFLLVWIDIPANMQKL